MRNSWEWTKEDLDSLVGQSENLRLEFKESRLLEKERSTLVKDLTKEVTAFANTEGGTIVIGIVERKDGQSKIADHVDEGVSSTVWGGEQLQQLIIGNISPQIMGLRVRSIPLDDERSRLAFAIFVPQGTSAYQAKDYIYYGRHEFQCLPLSDQEIRLRMLRGKAKSGSLDIHRRSIEHQVYDLEGETAKILNLRDLGMTVDQASQYVTNNGTLEIYNYSFFPILINLSEVNLDQYKVTVQAPASSAILRGNSPRKIFEVSQKDGWEIARPSYHGGGVDRHNVNIFPLDRYEIPRDCDISLIVAHQVTAADIDLTWTLYLHDTQPIVGIFNLGRIFEGIWPSPPKKAGA